MHIPWTPAKPVINIGWGCEMFIDKKSQMPFVATAIDQMMQGHGSDRCAKRSMLLPDDRGRGTVLVTSGELRGWDVP